jgi:hypothetical protein
MDSIQQIVKAFITQEGDFEIMTELLIVFTKFTQSCEKYILIFKTK